MKVITSFLTLLLFPLLFLPAFSLSFHSTGRRSMSDGGYSLSFTRDSMVIKTDVVSFGSPRGGGIIKLIDNPYSSSSLLPSFSLSSQSLISAALHISRFTVFSFYGERNGAGICYDGSYFDMALLYSQKEEDSSFQKDRKMRMDTSSFWAALSYERKGLLRITLLSSMSDFLSFSSLFNASLTFSFITLSYGMGRVQTLLDNAKPWYRHFSFSIENECFEIEHRLFLSRTPVYLREYRDYEYRAKASLIIGNVVLSDRIRKRFISGKTEREEKVSLTWDAFTVGFKRSTNSLYAVIEKDGFKAEIEDGKLSIILTEYFSEGDFTVKMKLTSDGTMSWVLTYGEVEDEDESEDDEEDEMWL